MRRRRAASGQRLIQSLNPRPAGRVLLKRDALTSYAIRREENQECLGGKPQPDAMPKLRINSMYANILPEQSRQSGSQLSPSTPGSTLADQKRAATGSRRSCASQAMSTVTPFFSSTARSACATGCWREIANTLGLHESTVSRVTTQKFMFYPARHIFELQVLLRSHRRHRDGGRVPPRHSGVESSTGAGKSTPETSFGQPRSPRSSAHRGSWSHAAPSPSTGVAADSSRSA